MSVFLKMCTSGDKIETFSPQEVKIFYLKLPLTRNEGAYRNYPEEPRFAY